MKSLPFRSALDWINSQKDSMVSLLRSWASINSESDNLPGLNKMLAAIEMRFASLKGKAERIDLPPRIIISPSGEKTTMPHGQALRITQRPDAPIKVFLGGHMDTVFSPSHSFQTVETIDENTLQGPGVADMKGGLIVMLTALEALEQHPYAKNIGWEVLINPDEEIGSIGSESLFVEAAKRNHVGLIFEPSFSDGFLVSSRKGAANISVFAKGKAAHAGRDFDKGHNALVGLADFISKAHSLCDKEKGVTVNIGYVIGGGPVNIVPDKALCRLNVRAVESVDFRKALKELHKLAEHSSVKGVSLSLQVVNTRDPKPFDEKCRKLFELLNACAKEEGYTLETRPSGGICDGNILAAAGLPVIDSLGVIGGELHTSNEYMKIDSLVQRSRLVALFLLKLGSMKG